MNEKNITSLSEVKEEKLHAFNRERYGDVIRRFRTEKGLNQPQLAATVGVNKNAVSKAETMIKTAATLYRILFKVSHAG